MVSARRPLAEGAEGTGEQTPEIGPRAYARKLVATPRRIAVLCVVVVVFLALSALLARWLQVENTERDDDIALIESEIRGDAQGMVDQLSGCRAESSCVALAKRNAANPRLRREGEVKILQLQSPTAYSLGGATGKTRLAWTVIGKLPVVQCVDVRRTGNAIGGVHVRLIGLSAPIQNEADC
jgi:hypothetical protein